MTRKDYVAAAQRFLDHRPPYQERAAYRVWETLVCAFADQFFAVDNPRFDRSRFLKAAGVQS